MIHFVGAGPGAVDLITLRGAKLLQNADVVIYAGSLVNAELLTQTGENCRIYNSAHMTLEEVIEVMEEAEKKSLATVRLHTGDPSLYGAIKEQLDELDKRKIAYDICPGVSSFSGAASSLQMEYTLPGISQSVIISRVEGRTKVPATESLQSLAAHQATMVLFLSSGYAKEVKEQLIEGGYPPETPAAVVFKATWCEEKILRTTLMQLPEEMDKAGIDKTALIIVGKVLEGQYERSKLYDASFTTGFRKGK